MTDAMAAVALTAETMARRARKPWYRRHKPTPFEFIDIAREVVGELISAGHIPRSALDAAGADTGHDEEER